MRLTLIAVSAILFAAPPVILGALAAKVAARHELFAGLAASLWGVSAIQWWPTIPTLPSEKLAGADDVNLFIGLDGGVGDDRIQFTSHLNRKRSQSERLL